ARQLGEPLLVGRGFERVHAARLDAPPDHGERVVNLAPVLGAVEDLDAERRLAGAGRLDESPHVRGREHDVAVERHAVALRLLEAHRETGPVLTLGLTLDRLPLGVRSGIRLEPERLAVAVLER